MRQSLKWGRKLGRESPRSTGEDAPEEDAEKRRKEAPSLQVTRDRLARGSARGVDQGAGVAGVGLIGPKPEAADGLLQQVDVLAVQLALQECLDARCAQGGGGHLRLGDIEETTDLHESHAGSLTAR